MEKLKKGIEKKKERKRKRDREDSLTCEVTLVWSGALVAALAGSELVSACSHLELMHAKVNAV